MQILIILFLESKIGSHLVPGPQHQYIGYGTELHLPVQFFIEKKRMGVKSFYIDIIIKIIDQPLIENKIRVEAEGKPQLVKMFTKVTAWMPQIDHLNGKTGKLLFKFTFN